MFALGQKADVRAYIGHVRLRQKAHLRKAVCFLHDLKNPQAEPEGVVSIPRSSALDITGLGLNSSFR
jgi:hypothetical protein